MSNRNYICIKCGNLRRAPAVYLLRGESWAKVRESPKWPKHCGQPMKQLSLVQGEGATQLTTGRRVRWVAKGLHVVRHRHHSKHKWKPVTADWQVEEAKREKAEYQTVQLGRNPYRSREWTKRKKHQ